MLTALLLVRMGNISKKLACVRWSFFFNAFFFSIVFFILLFFCLFFLQSCNEILWMIVLILEGMEVWIAAFCFLQIKTSSFYWMIMALSYILNYCNFFFALFHAFKNFLIILNLNGKNFHRSCKNFFIHKFF